MPIETQSAEQNDHHWGSLQYINSPDMARDDDDDEDRKRPNRIVAKAERKKQKSETARENSRNWFGQMGKGCRNLNEDLLRGSKKREKEGRQGSGTSWKLAAVCLAAYWCHACA